MLRAIILSALVATVNTVPILQNPQVLSTPKSVFKSKRQEHNWPLFSDAPRFPQTASVWQQVTPTSTPAPQVTAWQQSSSTSIVVPQTTSSDIHPSTTLALAFPVTTLPYIGPGILIIPETSLVPGLDAFATPAPTTYLPNGSDSPSRTSVHSVAAVGGTLAALIFLTICFCFLSDPRVWRSCRHGFSSRRRARFAQGLPEPQRRTLPSWIQPKSGYPFSAKLIPILSQKRKPREAPTEFGGRGGYITSTSIDSIPSSFSAPDLSKHKSLCLSVQDAPTSNGMIGRGDQASLQGPPGAPIHPPRLPLADSPAEIKPIHYADLDDKEFYRYPIAPLMSNPPTMTGIGAHSTLLPRVYPLSLPKPLSTNVPGQHTRSRSAPGLDQVNVGQPNSQTQFEE